MLGLRGDSKTPFLLASNLVFAHQPAHSLFPAAYPLGTQFGMNSRASVRFLALLVNGFDFGDQATILSLMLGFRPSSPCVISASRYLHHLAQQLNRIFAPLFFDESISQRDSLAKKAAAFFRISRSMRNRLFSSRNRCNSSSTTKVFPFPGKAFPPASLICFSHRRSIFSPIPRLSAA